MSGTPAIAYEVSGKTGSPKCKIQFRCPKCGTPIESPIEEAGRSFPCPACSAEFVTPGIEALRLHRASERAAAQKADEIRKAAAAQKAERASALELKPQAPINYAPKPAPQAVAVPEYKKILRGAETLDTIAWVLIGLGVLEVVGAIVILVIASSRAPAGALLVIPVLSGSVASCVVLFIVAALLRMIGSIGLAVRDIARNSFEMK